MGNGFSGLEFHITDHHRGKAARDSELEPGVRNETRPRRNTAKSPGDPLLSLARRPVGPICGGRVADPPT